IEGRLQYRTWENQDGQKRSKHEVLADRVQFMPRASRTSEGGVPGETGEGDAMEDDDVPF
ncbi:MAG: single-stranded DNA-binding protein, partial [Candidatus Entotheonellia bacterium]